MPDDRGRTFLTTRRGRARLCILAWPNCSNKRVPSSPSISDWKSAGNLHLDYRLFYIFLHEIQREMYTSKYIIMDIGRV